MGLKGNDRLGYRRKKKAMRKRIEKKGDMEEIRIKIWSTEEKRNRNKRKDNNIGRNVKSKRVEGKKKKNKTKL